MTPISLDLAFDADTVALQNPDAKNLKNQRIWASELQEWIETLRTDAALPCPAVLQQAEEASLGLRFTDDATIGELNSSWRQQTTATDVLSFAALDAADEWPDTTALESTSVELGDIVISIETARRQALEQQHSLHQELRWLISHGLLHLLGWDHPDDTSLQQMLALQERLLEIRVNVQISGITATDADAIRDVP